MPPDRLQQADGLNAGFVLIAITCLEESEGNRGSEQRVEVSVNDVPTA